MRIIKPSYEIMDKIDGKEVLKKLERIGRKCYKSEANIKEESAEKFVAGIIKSGHESVIEHYSFTVCFICDRGISHEIVRHRIASYTQESSRYCNYSNQRFGKEITVIEPSFFNSPFEDEETEKMMMWREGCEQAEALYFDLLEAGTRPEEARSVLTNSLKTELVMTANLREWRHFFALRCSKAAHPQMRELALPLLDEIHSLIPVVFDDLWKKYLGEEK